MRTAAVVAVGEVPGGREQFEAASGEGVVRAGGVFGGNAKILPPGDQQQGCVTDQPEPLETVEALSAQVQRAADGVHESVARPGVGERGYRLRDLVHFWPGDAGHCAGRAVEQLARPLRGEPGGRSQGERGPGKGGRPERGGDFAAEAAAGYQDQPLDEFGELVGELHRHAAAEE